VAPSGATDEATAPAGAKLQRGQIPAPVERAPFNHASQERPPLTRTGLFATIAPNTHHRLQQSEREGHSSRAKKSARLNRADFLLCG
jgi:hypothetical protein